MTQTGTSLATVLLLAWLAARSTPPAATRKPEAHAQLPPAVEKTFRTGFPEGEVATADTTLDEGVTVYRVAFLDGPLETETHIAVDGTLLDLATVVELDAVPATAMRAIRAAAPNARIRRIKHVTVVRRASRGSVEKLPNAATRYDAEVTNGARSAEIVVDAGGTMVEPITWRPATQ